MANRGVYIKSPFDLVIGSLRHFNINTNVSDATNYESQYKLWAYFNDTVCLQMEQQMGTIPNVSGWNAFYQTPAFHEYWINTNTVQKRFAFLPRNQNQINGRKPVGRPATIDNALSLQRPDRLLYGSALL